MEGRTPHRLTGPGTLASRLAEIADVVALHTQCNGCRGLIAARSIPAGRVLFSEVPVAYMTKAAQQELVFKANIARAKARPSARAAGGHQANTINHDPPMVDLSSLGICVPANMSQVQALAGLRDLQPATADGQELTLTALADKTVTNAAGAAFVPADVGMTGLLLAFSMMNHSCCPTAAWQSSWDEDVQAPVFTVYALKDIAQGEEVRIAYTPSSAPGPSRRVDLSQRYGFSCDCPRCVLPFDDTLARRCFGCGGPVRLERDKAVCHGRDGCDSNWLAGLASWLSGTDSKHIDGLATHALWAPASVRQVAGLTDLSPVNTVQRLSSIREDVLWWLEHEPGVHSLSCALALLHPSDVRLSQLLGRVLDQGTDTIVGGQDATDSTPTSLFDDTGGSSERSYEPIKPTPQRLLTLARTRLQGMAGRWTGDQGLPQAQPEDCQWRRPEEVLDAILTCMDTVLLACSGHVGDEQADTTAARAEAHALVGQATAIISTFPLLYGHGVGWAQHIQDMARHVGDAVPPAAHGDAGLDSSDRCRGVALDTVRALRSHRTALDEEQQRRLENGWSADA